MASQPDKATYQAATEAKMQELNAQIEALQVKANLAKAEAKVKYQEQLDSLRSQQADLKTKLASIKDSTESAWKEMKSGIESAWGELQVAFDKAKSEIDKA